MEISRHGGPDELVVVERADPVPAAGQLLVRNRWIGVNFVDLQHREGRRYPVRLPLIPGTEAARTVVTAGPGADPGLAGAPVAHFGHLAGVYAELTAVPPEFVVPLPGEAAMAAVIHCSSSLRPRRSFMITAKARTLAVTAASCGDAASMASS